MPRPSSGRLFIIQFLWMLEPKMLIFAKVLIGFMRTFARLLIEGFVVVDLARGVI